MSHNATITTIPILVDCVLGQKDDGLATWIDYDTHQRKVKIFDSREAESYKSRVRMTQVVANRLDRLKYLISAMQTNDRKDIAFWQEVLIEIVEKTQRRFIARNKTKEDWEPYLGRASVTISKSLSGVRLVFWRRETNLELALYCGADLDTAFWAYMLTSEVISIASGGRGAICPFCGNPFRSKKNKRYCSREHRAAAAQQRYRARLRKMQRRTRP